MHCRHVLGSSWSSAVKSLTGFKVYSRALSHTAHINCHRLSSDCDKQSLDVQQTIYLMCASFCSFTLSVALVTGFTLATPMLGKSRELQPTKFNAILVSCRTAPVTDLMLRSDSFCKPSHSYSQRALRVSQKLCGIANTCPGPAHLQGGDLVT